jgi:hypothetical protein
MRRDDADWASGDRDADFEVEVSSLDAPAAASTGAPHSRADDGPRDAHLFARDAGIDRGDATVGDDELEADPPFARRMTPRRRALAAGSALAAIVLALAVVFAGQAGGGLALPALFPTPAPTATLPPGADTVILTDSVPWGALTVDDRHVTPAAVNNVSGDFSQVTLGRGTHTLTYSAAPFPTLQCRVSVPVNSRDTCPQAAPIALKFAIALDSRVLDLQAIPSRLPPEQYAALVQAIQTAHLDRSPPGVLAKGDHYAAADGTTIVTATQELQATLLLSLDTSSAQGNTIKGIPCGPLCALPFGNGGPSGPSWNLLAVVTMAWQFNDAAGNIVQTSPITSGTPGAADSPVTLGIGVVWDGHWSVTGSGGTDPCQFGEERLSTLVADSASANQLPNTGYSFSAQGQQNTAQGCLVSVDGTLPPSPGTPYVPHALASVLYRYGAMIAADNAAHRLWPQLPLPSPNERRIIATLAAQQGPAGS